MRKLFEISALATVLVVALSTACSESPDEVVEDEVVEDDAEPTEEVTLETADPARFPEIVAKVNGTEISKSVLMARASRLKAQVPPTEDTVSVTYFREVLDELVGAELLYQASREKGGTVDAAAVEQQLGALRARFADQAAFEQALMQEGLTLDALKDEMTRDLTIQKLIETDIQPNVSVSEDDKKAFYDENPDEMSQPDRLRLSHILKRVPPDAPPEAKEAARAGLESILEQARGGSDFAALATEHSEDPGSAANGGELVVARGDTVPPFEQAAFALEPGGLSPVVETQFGFHIIRLSEKMNGELVPYEQVAPRIEEFLTQKGVQEEIESTVESLKAEGAVELFI